MEKICIAGGIGSGKSVVSRILRLKGHPVYDCDTRARSLLDGSDELRRSVAEYFGPEAFGADGRADRRYIASRVFANPEELAALNRMTHRAVLRDFEEFVASHADWRGPLFVESAIPVTSGLWRLCDAIWEVWVPQEERIRRCMLRDSCGREEVEARISAQKGELGGAVGIPVTRIDNGGNVALLPQIDSLLENTEHKHTK